MRGSLLLLTIALVSVCASSVQSEPLRRPLYPQDALLFDLILRNADDSDLLTPRQAALQAHFRRLGVDARWKRERPSLTTLLGATFADRARWNPWEKQRHRSVQEIDRRNGLVVTWSIPEWVLFESTVDTNVVGIAFSSQRDVRDSRVTLSVDGRDAHLRRAVSVAVADQWARQVKNRQQAAASSGQLLNFTIPVKLPRTLERIIGRGEATNIRITGTERISLGGKSTRITPYVGNELRQNQSLFPQLEMQQSLLVNLDGTVGEKIKVSVRHNSDAVGPEATKIDLAFEGDEDDIIRSIRAGNIDVTLPGSQLLGVGTGRGGLFGVKVEGALGPVEFTVVTSKEQAQQGMQTFNQAGGGEQEFYIDAVNYYRYRFFRLTAPFPFYFDGVDYGPVPLADQSLTELSAKGWIIDESSIQIFRAVLGVVPESNPDIIETGGVAILDPSGAGWADPASAARDIDRTVRRPTWERLRRGVDWEVLLSASNTDSVAGIQLFRSATDEDVIAVSYDIIDPSIADPVARVMRQVGSSLDEVNVDLITDPANPSREIHYFKLLKPPLQSDPVRVDGTFEPLALCWEYELRNFYPLGVRGVTATDVDFWIERNDSSVQQPQFTGSALGNLDWFRVFGLDQTGRNNTGPPDGIPDVGTGLINLQNGWVQFPSATPFDPSSPEVQFYSGGVIDSLPQTVRAPNLYRKIIRPGSAEAAAMNKFRLVTRTEATSSRLDLNAFNIREGSEEVTINGRSLSRGVDYDIDYFGGEINLKGEVLGELGSKPNIQVRFETDSLFGGGRTSLSGMNLTYRFGRQNQLSTTWLYQTKPNSATKVRLGEEPQRNLVGNLMSKLRFEPNWVGRISRKISREDSEQKPTVNLDTEVGVSIPNPNTKDIAYLDDFENVDQSNQISMARQGWHWASLPVRGRDALGQRRAAFQPQDRGYSGWQRAVPSLKRSEINPSLSEQESREVFPTLLMRVAANDSTAWGPSEFAGIMRGLGQLDLTQAQFLEFWIDDGTGYVDPSDSLAVAAARPGRLHFDFGTINEDFFWKRDGAGGYSQFVLDDEDVDGDRILSAGEDTGLDGIDSSEESLSDAWPWRPGSGSDPAGDDYSVVEDEELRAFLYINGTEDNKSLDTEDLNGNRSLDTKDGFYRITLELDDLGALVDPARDYRDDLDFIEGFRNDGRAWRKYRLDLRKILQLRRGDDDLEPAGYSSTEPDLGRVSSFRIWYEPEGDASDADPRFVERRFKFSEMRFLGNRWRQDEIRDEFDEIIPLADRGTQDFRLGVLNNKENPDYEPPIGVRVRNNVAELEQSLQFTYTDLEPGSRFRARKDLPGRLGEDYLNYGELNFFWRLPYRDGMRDPAQDDLEGYFWIGSDSTSYYEIAVPFAEVTPRANDWVDVSIRFSDLALLKETLAFDEKLVPDPDPEDSLRVNPDVKRGEVVDSVTGDVYRVTIRGRPDLRRVQRYYVGVRYPVPSDGSTAPALSGSVLFNELRVREVNREMGFAQRYTLSMQLPGVLGMNANFRQEDDEFRSLDRDRGSGKTSRTWNLSANTRLQNFLPLFGLDVPVNYSQRATLELPKYKPESDLELLDGGLQDRFKARTTGSSVSFQVRKGTRSERRLVQYTIDNISYTFSRGVTNTDMPTRTAETYNQDQSLDYNLALRRTPAIPLPFTRAKLQVLPVQFSWSGKRSYRTSSSATILIDDVTGAQTVVNPREDEIWSINNDLSMTLRPFESMPGNLNFRSVRDPGLSRILGPRMFLGMDIGYETSFAQGFKLTWRPPFRRLNFAGLNLEYGANYNENRDPSLRDVATIGGDVELSPALDGRLGRPTENRPTLGATRDISVRSRLDAFGWLKRRLRQRPAPAARRTVVDSTQVAAADSSGGRGVSLGFLVKPFRTAAENFDPINIQFRMKRNSSYQQVNDRADWLYRFGITSSPDFAAMNSLPIGRNQDGELVYRDFSRERLVDDKNLSLSARTKLAESVTLDLKYGFTKVNREDTGRAPSYDQTIDWPDVAVSVQRVQEWRMFRWLGERLESARTDLNYRKSSSYRGVIEGAPQYPEVSTVWSNNWNSRLASGTDLNLRLSRNERLSESATHITTQATTGATLTIQQSFNARGRMSFLRFGRKATAANIDMNLGLDFRDNGSARTAKNAIDPSAQDRVTGTRSYSIRPQFTYGFTQNLTGGLRLEYSQTKNKSLDTTSQSVGIFFDATLKF